MTEKPTNDQSGNRWEPTDAPHVAEHHPTEPGVPHAPEVEQAPSEGLPERLREAPRRPLLAAGAVAVALAVGLGGFGVGRATAPDGAGGPSGDRAGLVDDGGRVPGDHRYLDGDDDGDDGGDDDGDDDGREDGGPQGAPPSTPEQDS